MNLIKTIKREIETCGKSRYRIAQETGIEQNQLHRLVNGGSLKAETASLLLEYFGYRLEKKKGR
jgi:plasmid maintenance system antidote protein VapI